MSTRTLYKVFVYGTLKKGEPNHEVFKINAQGYFKFLYNGKTSEKFPLIIATPYNIPFLLLAPGKGHNVHGEVYEVDEKVLSSLDELEGHPNYYVRQQHEVYKIDTKLSEKVWIYVIKSFKKDLLSKTMYRNYSNSDSHGLKYVERYLRDTTCDVRSEVLDPDGN